MSTQQELKQQGNIHFQNDDFEKAIEFYTLAIEQDAFCDEAAPILSNRSLCYYNIGKYKEAYEDAGCCCGIRPDWAKGFARRGAAAEELKEWQIALESYNEYLKLSENDEMGIAAKKNRVKKFVDAIEKRKLKKEQAMAALEAEFSNMDSNIDESSPSHEKEAKKCKVYHTLTAGCEETDIEIIELAVKNGADLGEHFLSKEAVQTCTRTQMKEVRKYVNDFDDLRFLPPEFTSAEEIYSEDPLSDAITCGAREALNFLRRESHRSKMSEFEQTDLLIRQRNYFDRLLDLPKKQQQKYVPSVIVSRYINFICTYDASHPIRDDLVMILLEKGKRYFFGDDEHVTEKEFKKIVLRCVLFGGSFMVSSDLSLQRQGSIKVMSEASNPSTNSSLRKLLACLRACLSGLTAEDLNTCCGSHISNCLPPVAREAPVFVAAAYHHSPLVTQLLLDRGADVNAVGQFSPDDCEDDNFVMTSFFASLTMGSLEVAELLLSRGAKLPREKVPEWVHARFKQYKSADNMMAPQEYYSPLLKDIMSAAAGRSLHGSEGIEKEKIPLIFDALTDQNLCLFADPEDNGDSFHTPLTAFIGLQAPVDRVELVIKTRPKLLYTPFVSKLRDVNWYPFAQVIFFLQDKRMFFEYAKKVARLMMENGVNFFTTVVGIDNEDGSSTTASVLCEGVLKNARANPEKGAQIKSLYDYCTDFEMKRGNFK